MIHALPPPSAQFAIQDQPGCHQRDRIRGDEWAIAGEQPVDPPKRNPRGEQRVHAQENATGIAGAQVFDGLQNQLTVVRLAAR